ncbi:MAG TPA: stage II sporulation protein M, partial [Gemmataceae bacterium]|nr:stage II sporulation protein M [Gemmataceae bacterium]
TAWLLFVNGVILGALGAVFVEAHQLTAYATGVLPHGVLEIPAILIAGAAGFVLAQGMISARPWPRMAELAHSGKAALLMVAGCLPLMGVAALLEAGVARAPDWFMGSGLKLAVAGIFFLIFVAYVLLLGEKATQRILS